MSKTLSNTSMNVQPTVQVYGDPSRWVTIAKAWDESEGWMKTTKVFALPSGCLVQVSTQQGDHVAEALAFVPGATLPEFMR